MGFGGGVGSFLIFGSFIFEDSFLQKGEVIWKIAVSGTHLFHLFTPIVARILLELSLPS